MRRAIKTENRVASGSLAKCRWASPHHESGGEPGTPELEKRPVRNCCTILSDADKTEKKTVSGGAEERRCGGAVAEAIGGVTHPSTAGERSGLLLPLDRYLLWLCRRGWRPGPQCSVEPSRPPMEPPIPAGTEPPIGPPPKPPRPPRSPNPPSRPPGSRGSESGVLPSVNGRSSSRRCHSCGRGGGGGGVGPGRGEEFTTRSLKLLSTALIFSTRDKLAVYTGG